MRSAWTALVQPGDEEEIEELPAAEYLLTVPIAMALAEAHPRKVRIESLIGRSLNNRFARALLRDQVPDRLWQGRIDIVISRDPTRIIPWCLIEVKRAARLTEIREDAERLATLISLAKPQSDLFGFCLFPTDDQNPQNPSGAAPHDLQQFHKLCAYIETKFPALSARVEQIGEAITRPQIVRQDWEGATEEDIVDPQGFAPKAAVLMIERRPQAQPETDSPTDVQSQIGTRHDSQIEQPGATRRQVTATPHSPIESAMGTGIVATNPHRQPTNTLDLATSRLAVQGRSGAGTPNSAGMTAATRAARLAAAREVSPRSAYPATPTSEPASRPARAAAVSPTAPAPTPAAQTTPTAPARVLVRRRRRNNENERE